MTNYRAIIIDDQENNIEIIEHYIHEYSPDIQVVAKAGTVETAITAINEYNPDIIFLDVELDTGTAFDVLSRVKLGDCKVIFATAHNKYAVQAFEYKVFDYLLKPINIERFQEVLVNVKRDLNNQSFTLMKQVLNLKNYIDQSNKKPFIVVKSMHKVEIVQLADICYIKSEGAFSIFKLHSKEIVSSKSLGRYEESLPKDLFFRVHHSYLVNITQIEYINKKEAPFCFMNNGDKIPISKRKLKTIVEVLSSHE